MKRRKAYTAQAVMTALVVLLGSPSSPLGAQPVWLPRGQYASWHRDLAWLPSHDQSRSLGPDTSVLTPRIPRALPRDAVRHAGSSASIQFMGYGGLRVLSVHKREAVITSVGVALLAGIGKELRDRAGHGDASVRDLVWDVVGIGFGVALSQVADR